MTVKTTVIIKLSCVHHGCPSELNSSKTLLTSIPEYINSVAKDFGWLVSENWALCPSHWTKPDQHSPLR